METTYEDKQLVEAVKGLGRVYEKMGRTDDCVRLTAEQASRLAELAEWAYWQLQS